MIKTKKYIEADYVVHSLTLPVVELRDFSEATDREILQWALFKIGLQKDPYYRASDGGYYIELFDDGENTFGYTFDKNGKLIK